MMTDDKLKEALSCADLGGNCGSSWHCERLATEVINLQANLIVAKESANAHRDAQMKAEAEVEMLRSERGSYDDKAALEVARKQIEVLSGKTFSCGHCDALARRNCELLAELDALRQEFEPGSQHANCVHRHDLAAAAERERGLREALKKIRDCHRYPCSYCFAVTQEALSKALSQPSPAQEDRAKRMAAVVEAAKNAADALEDSMDGCESDKSWAAQIWRNLRTALTALDQDAGKP